MNNFMQVQSYIHLDMQNSVDEKIGYSEQHFLISLTFIFFFSLLSTFEIV